MNDEYRNVPTSAESIKPCPFCEVPSAMSYRLWEQGGHERDPEIGEVALYES